MAQRLIRVICPKCRETCNDLDPRIGRMLGFTKEELAKLTYSRGKGCDACNGTGFHGRQGIFELMLMNNELRELAFRGAALGELRQAALATGMRNLLADGRLKIARGVTTPDEIIATAQTGELILE